ncbi:MAG: hypothetical protein GFH27_549293n336 [Chloroflexi bacterium AL-W]|nr:hypothetical protein [Chloroflexi bacterium AL-N1]NOK67549.1 hypothetical protein [Chloroflexi bacterium AL-N10]NOK75681.1 hypothetical protein [Chloroflexi bacterium AL-N5]NOK82469.1 hypothetical protein [Chloroflexi bacterium AL-W]NOK90314.1 hypothetical protein [Chloroflexi bacterium AL-N15]
MYLQDKQVRAPLDLFHRTYHSLLRSSGEIQIEALVEPYLASEPSLHHDARATTPDLSALTYTSLRLPGCIDAVRLVLLGQSHEVFARHGYGDVLSWQLVSAPGRRRKMFFDGEQTLAVLIASPSDVDDLLPILVAFQHEWNKIHNLLIDPKLTQALQRVQAEDIPFEEQEQLLEPIGLRREDLARLRTIWGERMAERLLEVGRHRKRFAVRMLGGSLLDYERASLRWWWHIEESLPDINFHNRPIYFVSSNTHSLVNLLSGFALRNTDELLAFLRERHHAGLQAEYDRIVAAQVPSSLENFFYYVQKKYQSDPSSEQYFARRALEEQYLGIHRVQSRFYLAIDAQVIELGRLQTAKLDPRIRVDGIERLQESDALVVNIDYPLGLAAYNILKIIARSVGQVCGVYVLGKAATLNGKIGDVLIPNVVYDEHTGNTYNFIPAFTAFDVEPYIAHGSVLDNQKAITSRGTFLQNESLLDVLYRAFYTDIEMEAGPYLNAMYEQTFAVRYPTDEVISFLRPPFDFGFLHYASDTPYSKGHNLGSHNLSYFGMDPTYATSLAIARRIVQQELQRLNGVQHG